MQLVRSSAGVGDTEVEALYFLAIASARETIDLTAAAYFAPRSAFVDALSGAAAGRDVRVRVLVPGSNIDKPIIRQAGRHATTACSSAASRSSPTGRRRCTPRR